MHGPDATSPTASEKCAGKLHVQRRSFVPRSGDHPLRGDSPPPHTRACVRFLPAARLLLRDAASLSMFIFQGRHSKVLRRQQLMVSQFRGPEAQDGGRARQVPSGGCERASAPGPSPSFGWWPGHLRRSLSRRRTTPISAFLLPRRPICVHIYVHSSSLSRDTRAVGSGLLPVISS